MLPAAGPEASLERRDRAQVTRREWPDGSASMSALTAQPLYCC